MKCSSVGLALAPQDGLGQVRRDVRDQLARWGRSELAEGWRVEISLVALRHIRGVDVARAARHAGEERVAALFPAETTPAQVSVTVTGLV
ncbi:hypothetical protein [Streptomyces sp. NBC_01451]|uniref:hypothetical protein n=1 Tax=Streptomyces sp. NBC_01451 TaxID=2903872 RepID=UPI002E2F3828|nr:hypothetical protein [Streptomyces sp. NBC_01451]